MKNLLLLLVTIVCIYLYMHPAEERVMPTVAQQVAAPQGPKYYYHSPLDAPAMSTHVSTGMGYYSAEPNSRFSSYQLHTPVVGGSQAAGGSYGYGSGGSVSNTVIYNNNTGASTASYGGSQSSPRSYVSGRAPSYGSDTGR